MGFIDEAASLPVLRAALESAAQNRGRPGPDGVSVSAFAAGGKAELERLRGEMVTGAYHPRPALRVRIPKAGGGHRELAIGCVRDRVVQHALARVLSDQLDGVLHPAAYAWRKGRSARQCLAAVDAALADELGIGTDAAVSLAESLRRFDGGAAAEALARLGRYEDADAVVALSPPDGLHAPAPGPPRGLPVEPAEVTEAPRLDPLPEDRERLFALFGGAEHTFLRDVSVGERIERQRVNVAPTVEHVRAHLDGAFWMGVYPLRANNSTRWAAFRVVVAARARREFRSAALHDAVIADGRALLAALASMELTPAISVEPGRALVRWVLFAEAVTAARARSLLALASQRAGSPDPAVTREVFPVQEVVKPDKPGSAMLLPLGRDPRSGERAWFLDASLAPSPDACGYLRAIAPASAEAVAEALGVRPRGALPVKATAERPPPPKEVPVPRPPDAVAMETSPFREFPRAQEVYRGCAVLRHLVDQAVSGAGMPTGDRMLVADVLGRLGQESGAAAEAVFRHLDDYRPGMGARLVQRIYPHPTSCGRIRQRMPELTARVGCDCRFRVPPGAYPTPVLHALGAAEVPGMAERVRETASRGGLARAAMEAMNEGRKELGVKAAALCARLDDLRRQARVLEKTVAGVEAELDTLVEEAGEDALETPAGTLRRVVEGGRRRFVLEV